MTQVPPFYSELLSLRVKTKDFTVSYKTLHDMVFPIRIYLDLSQKPKKRSHPDLTSSPTYLPFSHSAQFPPLLTWPSMLLPLGPSLISSG